jgi:hypothetical protein
MTMAQASRIVSWHWYAIPAIQRTAAEGLPMYTTYCVRLTQGLVRTRVREVANGHGLGCFECLGNRVAPVHIDERTEKAGRSAQIQRAHIFWEQPFLTGASGSGKAYETLHCNSIERNFRCLGNGSFSEKAENCDEWRRRYSRVVHEVLRLENTQSLIEERIDP